MSSAPPQIQSVTIIGAGIIGLSCALDIADQGIDVSLFDTQWPPRGASWAAAGMLAPAFEAAAEPDTHPQLFDLCSASAALWAQWSRQIEARTNLPSGYHPGPSLALARTPDEVSHLRAIQTRMKDLPDRPRPCPLPLSRTEPAIRSNILEAVWLPSDGQVENRHTLAALVACCDAHPNIKVHAGTAPINTTAQGLDHAGADATLVTAGWQSSRIQVQGEAQSRPIRDWARALDQVQVFGGQMLSLAPIAGGPRQPIRCGDLYIVPKSDRIIIGATMEPGRAVSQVEDAAIEALLTSAIEICPVLADAEILERWSGNRPGTADRAPLLGATETPGLFVATGHYRNGILLAPITAQIMTEMMVDGSVSPLAQAFSPARYQTEQV